MSDILNIQLLTPEEIEDGGAEITTEVPAAVKKAELTKSPEDVAREKLAADEKAKADEANKSKVDNSILTKEEVETPEEVVKKPLTKKQVDSVFDYKALAEYKVEQGDWDKWDNWEDQKDKIEWTPELYASLEKEQFDNKVQKAIDEEKASLPHRIKEITEFIKNGGKEEELYSSFQQEKDIESLDPSDDSQAEEIIKAHYQAVGMADKRIKSLIDNLKDEEGLKEAAEESKNFLVSNIKEERTGILKEQEARAEQTKIYWETFNKKLRNSIHKDEVPEREKKELEKFIFEYKYEDPTTGNKFSEFGKKFEEIKQDPEKYHKFLKFIRDFDDYEKKNVTDSKTKAKVFNLLRSGQEELTRKNTTSESPELQPASRKGQYNPFGSLT